MWDPQQYAKFADHRNRPFHELVARVRPDTEPRLVVDLGCGNGPLTLSLAIRWPHARIVGVDSSPGMLEAARRLDVDGRVEWIEADIATVLDDVLPQLGARPDVIVTNAALQWVPTHRELLGPLAAATTWFAMQVPGNHTAPSHALMREVALRQPRGAEIVSQMREIQPTCPAAEYLGILKAALPQALVDAWETTYVQVLDPDGAQGSPVLEWVRGTGLRPVLAAMEPAEQEAFLVEYDAALQQAYPRQPWGVPYPFRRIFAVACNEG